LKVSFHIQTRHKNAKSFCRRKLFVLNKKIKLKRA
jgi:hypothetical protein